MRSEPTPNGAGWHGLRVAVLADTELPPWPGYFLSRPELVEHRARPGGERRRRHLRGRVVAKRLLLGPLANRPRLTASVPAHRRLTSSDLLTLSGARYRELRIASGGRAPRVESAFGLTPQISLSHTDGVSAACVDETGVCGIDLELVVERSSAFYRRSFTAAERRTLRRFASPSGGAGRLEREWLYTFLWSVKEAVLKTGWSAIASAIDFGALEVSLPEERYETRPLLLAARRGGVLQVLAIEIDDGRRRAALELAVTTLDRRVMVVVRQPSAEPHRQRGERRSAA